MKAPQRLDIFEEFPKASHDALNESALNPCQTQRTLWKAQIVPEVSYPLSTTSSFLPFINSYRAPEIVISKLEGREDKEKSSFITLPS